MAVVLLSCSRALLGARMADPYLQAYKKLVDVLGTQLRVIEEKRVVMGYVRGVYNVQPQWLPNVKISRRHDAPTFATDLGFTDMRAG